MPEPERTRFNRDDAPILAIQAGFVERDRPSDRFAYFSTDDRLCMVAGAQERNEVGLALAYGMTRRGDKALTLILPESHTLSTLQRAPWIREEVGLEIWSHRELQAKRSVERSRQDTIDEHSVNLKANQSPGTQFTKDATPAHLGDRSKSVFALVEWASKDPRLDPGHRQSERSWHCMGQKVLSFKWNASQVKVWAGIHDAALLDHPTAVLDNGDTLNGATLDDVKAAVEEGIRQRLAGQFRRPDEHWMQAVVRQLPSIVGVEQPALRELPVWRPKASDLSESSWTKKWGRGYIDIAGLDGHGNLRIVEIKRADNDDPLLVLQGLDYYIWSLALENTLTERLGASAKSKTELHFVVGDSEVGVIKHSPYTAPLAQNLHPSVPWQFQTIRHWFNPGGGHEGVTSKLFEPGVVPDED